MTDTYKNGLYLIEDTHRKELAIRWDFGNNETKEEYWLSDEHWNDKEPWITYKLLMKPHSGKATLTLLYPLTMRNHKTRHTFLQLDNNHYLERSNRP